MARTGKAAAMSTCIVPTTFRRYRMVADGDTRSGHRATPIVAMDSGSRRVAAALLVLAELSQDDRGIRANADDTVVPQTVRRRSRDSGRRAKDHRVLCLLRGGWRHRRSTRVVPVRLLAADPAWCLATGAIPFLSEIDPRHGALIRTAVEGADTFERKREMVTVAAPFRDVYGDHEGAAPGPCDRIATTTISDTIAVLLYQRSHGGRLQVGRADGRSAAHVVDIDIYHTTRDRSAYNQGLFSGTPTTTATPAPPRIEPILAPIAGAPVAAGLPPITTTPPV